MLLIGAAAARAQSATELKVLAVDPAPDVLLARQQPFFVRFAVKAAAPVAVSVSGYFKGQAVIENGGTSVPASLPAGGGIGVVDLFYWGERPTRIDEVRLKISHAGAAAPDIVYAFPVAITWLTDEPPPREPAAWVREWQQARGAQGNGAAAPADETEPAFGPGVWAALAAGILFALFAICIHRRRRAPRAPGDANGGR